MEYREITKQIDADGYGVGAAIIESLVDTLLKQGLIPEEVGLVSKTDRDPLISSALTFGGKVRDYRNHLGMNLIVLAERVGLTYSHLSKVERDTRPAPSIKNTLNIIDNLRLFPEQAKDLLRTAGYSDDLPKIRELMEKPK